MPDKIIVSSNELGIGEGSGVSVKEYMKNNHSKIDVDKLKRCKGIVHYKRNGSRTVVNEGNYDSKDKLSLMVGDILIISDSCKSGKVNKVKKSSISSSYAFGVTDNEYVGFMENNPEISLIRGYGASNLSQMLECIINGNSIDKCINDIYIISHGAMAILYVNLTGNSKERANYYQLSRYVSKYGEYSDRQEVKSRQVDSDTNIHIRGCNVGESEEFVKLVYRLFGNPNKVTAPLHTDRFGHYEGNKYYEILLNNTVVYTNEHPDNDLKVPRKKLIKAFKDKREPAKNAEFSKKKWGQWIPSESNLRSDSGDKLEINVSMTDIKSEIPDVEAEYEYEVEEVGHYKLQFNNGNVPRDRKNQEGAMKDRFDRRKPESCRPDYPSKKTWGLDSFPMYKYWGYSNFNDYINRVYWKFDADEKGGILNCRAYRTRYEFSMPIVNGDHVLLANILENGEFVNRTISEDDDDLFRIISSGP